MSVELLQQYCTDGDAGSAARVAEAHAALAYSVCRRYLRRREDVEDAVQETLLKLLRHAAEIRGEVGPWLCRCAAATSIDLIRRQSAQRARARRRGQMPLDPAWENRLLHEQVRLKLDAALGCLEPAQRQLIVERFFNHTPLRLLAGQYGASVPTLSRRVADAVAALSAVLRRMGLESVDDLTIAEFFDNAASPMPLADEELRFTPDWHGLRTLLQPTKLLPGWSRTLRVGIVASYASIIAIGYRGSRIEPTAQVETSQFLTHPGIQLVGVIEPHTGNQGIIESLLRDYELLGGLIDATDAEGLATLDVLVLGINFALPPAVVRALHAAVRGGLGLLKEWWIGRSPNIPPTDWQYVQDPLAADLLLAGSPVYHYHGPQCCLCTTASIRQQHPLLAGAAIGAKGQTRFCGPLYLPAPGAQVLISKDFTVPPDVHGIAGAGTLEPPTFVVGTLGRGRIAAIHDISHLGFMSQVGVGPDYVINLMQWLAEPRRTADKNDCQRKKTED